VKKTYALGYFVDLLFVPVLAILFRSSRPGCALVVVRMLGLDRIVDHIPAFATVLQMGEEIQFIFNVQFIGQEGGQLLSVAFHGVLPSFQS
jgi:hypothetical protein